MTRTFSLIGHPLSHTMSPPIHKQLFELSNKPSNYNVCDIAPENLEGEMPRLFEYCGFNVTIPHKVAIIPMLNSLDETAIRYGAVNVVDCKTKRGYNTDVVGFTRAIKGLGSSLDKSVLLLGCGGAGRMMAIETAFSGGDLTIAVRDSDIAAANALAIEMTEKTGHTPKVIKLADISGKFDLLLNSTPVGMYPNINACPVSEEVIKNSACVFDAVYNPCKTQLVKLAEQNAIPAGGGMAMLVWQAVAAHEIWDNAEYTPQDINKIIDNTSKLVEQQG